MRVGRSLISSTCFLSVAVYVGFFANAVDAPAGADLAILKVIPEDALAFAVVTHIDRFDEQEAKVANELQLPAPGPMLAMLKAMTREGVDDRGPAAIVLFQVDENSPPAHVWVVPVPDYKKLIGQLNSAETSDGITKVAGQLIAKKGDFALFTDSESTGLLKKVLNSSKPITPVIGRLSDWIGQHELAVVATPTGVKRGIGIARKALADVKAAMANAKEETAKMMAGNLEAYDVFLAAAEREVSTAGVAFHVDENGGLHIDTRTIFVSSGSWAAAGKDFEHTAGTQLACLPNSSFMMAFDGAISKGFSKGFMNFSVEMMNNMSQAAGGQPLSDEQKKKINDAMQGAMTDVRSMSMVMGPPKPGSSIYSNMAAAMKVKDSKKFIANYEKVMAGMREAYKGTNLESFMPQEAKKTKIGDLDGLELTMDMSKLFGKMPNAPGSKQMLQMLFGPDAKLNVYVAPVDDSTVAISYVNSDNIARIQAACKNPQSSLAGNADVAQTAKLLPSGAQWVVYLNPKGFVDFVSALFLGMAAGGGPQMPALPEFPRTPPVGFGAELSGTGLDLNVVVPGEALKGVGAYIMQMKQARRTAATAAAGIVSDAENVTRRWSSAFRLSRHAR